MSQPNNQHAAILREMAEGLPRRGGTRCIPEHAASMVAGAEALESVEVAKAALRPFAEAHELSQLPHDEYMELPRDKQERLPHLLSIHKLCAEAHAALARLEGK